MELTDGKKPSVPMIALPSPKASPKPTAQYTSEQIPKIRTFLPAMWPAFFMRVRPASRNAKPACMNITRIAVTTTQIVEAPISRSSFVISDLGFLEPQPGPLVRDVLDLRLPDETVCRL